MAFPGLKRTTQSDFNFFQKLSVNWTQFGAPDGYTTADGYGADMDCPHGSYCGFVQIDTAAVCK